MAKPKKEVKEPEDVKDVVTSESDVETPEARLERKAALPQGPVPKKKAQLVAPDISNLYPWAVNRGKAKRAHDAILSEPNSHQLTKEEFDQKVMDHYVAHSGLVRGYEKQTTMGRRKPIRPESAPEAGDGSTTDEIIGGAIEEEDDD